MSTQASFMAQEKSQQNIIFLLDFQKGKFMAKTNRYTTWIITNVHVPTTKDAHIFGPMMKGITACSVPVIGHGKEQHHVNANRDIG